MKITKAQLRELIKEELEANVNEGFIASAASGLMSMLPDETRDKVFAVTLAAMFMANKRLGFRKGLTIEKLMKAAISKKIDLVKFVEDWMNKDLEDTALDDKYGDLIVGKSEGGGESQQTN